MLGAGALPHSWRRRPPRASMPDRSAIRSNARWRWWRVVRDDHHEIDPLGACLRDPPRRHKDQSNRHRAAGPSSCADRTAVDQARFCSLRRSPTHPGAHAPKRRRAAPDGPPAALYAALAQVLQYRACGVLSAEPLSRQSDSAEPVRLGRLCHREGLRTQTPSRRCGVGPQPRG